jgi:nucleoside-diphosphate-sugar epimerase
MQSNELTHSKLMKPGARIIVAGGNRGWIGANLCHRLKQAGYEVETISSSTSSFLADWNWYAIWRAHHSISLLVSVFD